jgi:hypothetical protein
MSDGCAMSDLPPKADIRSAKSVDVSLKIGSIFLRRHLKFCAIRPSEEIPVRHVRRDAPRFVVREHLGGGSVHVCF